MYLNVSQMYLRCISDVSQCISSASPVQGSQGDLIDSCWVVLNMLIIAVGSPQLGVAKSTVHLHLSLSAIWFVP